MKNILKTLKKKTGLKIRIVATDNGSLPVIDDMYEKLLPPSSDYKSKVILDRFRFTYKSNEISENIFLLMDIMELDPRAFLLDFKFIWLEALKIKIPSGLSDSYKTRFIQILHYLASKEETELRKNFFVTEGTNVNLRSGPGTENANITKLNKESVFQIDSDFNTITIGNKTGKWIQIYVFSSDTVGWIFSPFLKNIELNKKLAMQYEAEISNKNNFTVIDFNNWNPSEIPGGFYGNYLERKKEIFEANIGFPVYASSSEEGICTKIKNNPQRILIQFLNVDSKERVTLVYLKPSLENGSKKKHKLQLQENKLFLNDRQLEIEFEKKKEQSIDLRFLYEDGIKLSIYSLGKEYFDMVAPKEQTVKAWELCIPQGKKSSSSALLFSFKIY